MATKEKNSRPSGKPVKTRGDLADVAIVGGGLSGLTLACLLGARGMSVICMDAQDPSAAPRDLRTTAISFGSQKILARAGIWEKIRQACPIEDIKILDGGSPVLLRFQSEEVGGRAFGWICDNHDMKQAMLARMAELKTVKHIAPVNVSGFEAGPDYAAAHLETGERIKARLIIGADGRGSALRRWLTEHHGLRTRGWSYGQRAVICCVAHQNPHHNVAVEHFYPQGPFAILPMADGPDGTHRSSVVFTEHGSERTSWMRMPDADFEVAMASRFPESYGDVRMLGSRAAYPLTLSHAAEYIGPRMALVADAAHGIHPIAGQGLNLGFRDLDVLDSLLGRAWEAGGDIGAQALLGEYQQIRRPDNMAMVAVTDALVRLFSNDLPPVRALRRAGLRMVAKCPPAKGFFMKQAMGDR